MASNSSSRVFNACRPLFTAAKSHTSTAAAPPPPAASASKPSPAAAKKKKTAVAKPTAKKQPITTFSRPPGILKLLPISPALRNFLGVPESARTEAVKKIWDYIKLHNLQNPMNGREIVCDNELKKIFEGRERVGFLEVPKLLTPHFVKN